MTMSKTPNTRKSATPEQTKAFVADQLRKAQLSASTAVKAPETDKAGQLPEPLRAEAEEWLSNYKEKHGKPAVVSQVVVIEIKNKLLTTTKLKLGTDQFDAAMLEKIEEAVKHQLAEELKAKAANEAQALYAAKLTSYITPEMEETLLYVVQIGEDNKVRALISLEGDGAKRKGLRETMGLEKLRAFPSVGSKRDPNVAPASANANYDMTLDLKTNKMVSVFETTIRGLPSAKQWQQRLDVFKKGDVKTIKPDGSEGIVNEADQKAEVDQFEKRITSEADNLRKGVQLFQAMERFTDAFKLIGWRVSKRAWAERDEKTGKLILQNGKPIIRQEINKSQRPMIIYDVNDRDQYQRVSVGQFMAMKDGEFSFINEIQKRGGTITAVAEALARGTGSDESAGGSEGKATILLDSGVKIGAAMSALLQALSVGPDGNLTQAQKEYNNMLNNPDTRDEPILTIGDLIYEALDAFMGPHLTRYHELDALREADKPEDQKDKGKLKAALRAVQSTKNGKSKSK